MKAGRELDALVAEKVMGLRVKWATSYDGEPHPVCPSLTDARAEDWEPCPWYSTDVADAWEVVERLRQMDYVGLVVKAYPLGLKDQYVASVPGSTTAFAEAQTAPHAICVAALKAVGAEVPA